MAPVGPLHVIEGKMRYHVIKYCMFIFTELIYICALSKGLQKSIPRPMCCSFSPHAVQCIVAINEERYVLVERNCFKGLVGMSSSRRHAGAMPVTVLPIRFPQQGRYIRHNQKKIHI